jgi:NAD(P)H-dependent flavin oxidoreductase YrpB (nitropropane dioxygenase family)
MKLFTEFFNCKYPIASMAMNRVSDIQLAKAIRSAGGLPSLSIFNYYIGPATLDFAAFRQDLIDYTTTYPDGSILISVDSGCYSTTGFVDTMIEFNIKCVEVIRGDILDDDNSDENTGINNSAMKLKKHGTLTFVKALGIYDLDNLTEIDGVIVKGSEGAGRGNTSKKSLKELVLEVQEKLPNMLIIPAGGIGTSEQVKEYMDMGMFAIGIGTMFAACVESKISTESKLKMVSASSADLSRLNNGTISDYNQSALVFEKVNAPMDFNNTRGLIKGIVDPSSGHIFAGRGIDHITEILPASEVIQRLVKDL